MRQSQIVDIVHDTLRREGIGTRRGVVRSIMADLIATISLALRGGQSINLRGFGTFYVHDYRGRKGLKPHLPRKQPKFRAGRSLKQIVNARDG